MSRAVIAASIGTATLVWIRAIASSREAVMSWETTITQSMNSAVLHNASSLPLSSTKPDSSFVMCGSRTPTRVASSVSPTSAA